MISFDELIKRIGTVDLIAAHETSGYNLRYNEKSKILFQSLMAEISPYSLTLIERAWELNDICSAIEINPQLLESSAMINNHFSIMEYINSTKVS